MNQEELKNKYIIAQSRRGEIISYFCTIEFALQDFIIASYFEGKNEKIQLEVFQNSYFTSALLKSIFTTVLKNHTNLELYKKFKQDKLDGVLAQLCDIRNLAAHGPSGMNNVVLEGMIITDQSEFTIHRGDYGETMESLHKRFLDHYNTFVAFLDTLPGISKLPFRLN